MLRSENENEPEGEEMIERAWRMLLRFLRPLYWRSGWRARMKRMVSSSALRIFEGRYSPCARRWSCRMEVEVEEWD